MIDTPVPRHAQAYILTGLRPNRQHWRRIQGQLLGTSLYGEREPITEIWGQIPQRGLAAEAY